MKAVNLIPGDQRRGAGGVAGRAGGAVYVLLGGLALLVVMSVLYAISANQVSDRQGRLTSVNAQADAVQSQATALQPYVTFAGIRQTREQAIASLAANRFDWAAAMDQVARALPNDVTLTALTGGMATPTPGVSTPAANAAAVGAPAGAAGSTPAPTPAAPVLPAAGPSVTLVGCATTHSEVANVLVALHRIVGVAGVSLSSSQKPLSGAASNPTCPTATFTATLGYAATAAAAAPTNTSTTNGVSASTATSPTAGSTR